MMLHAAIIAWVPTKNCVTWPSTSSYVEDDRDGDSLKIQVCDQGETECFGDLLAKCYDFCREADALGVSVHGVVFSIGLLFEDTRAFHSFRISGSEMNKWGVPSTSVEITVYPFAP